MCVEGRGRWGKGRERKGVGKGNRRVGILVPPHAFYQFNHCLKIGLASKWLVCIAY
jgi:hypothetical protein